MRSLLLFLLVPLFLPNTPAKKVKKPNIVYILADDLGYGELGVYGQELIETPNIDALAAEGMRFTQNYSGAPVCAPARCTLMTGKHAGHNSVRGNSEMRERGNVWSVKAMMEDPYLEGQGPMTETFTLPSFLKENGYRTGMIGKWGLGGPTTESLPGTRGFDYFLGYNCQRMAHTYYPPFLWKNKERILLDNRLVEIHANLAEGADPNDPESYKDFELTSYSPDVMHEGALNFIRENKDEPFFLYYASPLPHVPLQAPKRWVEYYEKKLGREEPFTGKSYYPNRTPHATYAAMISYLDEEVGELVAELKKQGLYENTLIIFTSDNGPTYTGGVDASYFKSAAPFGKGFGKTKGFVYEGGIRVPMIAVWPNKIEAGSTSDLMTSFPDVLPTCADLLGEKLGGKVDGLSFLPTLLGKKGQEKHAYLYWEFPQNQGQQALRMGHWKAVRKDIQKGNMHIELYDLDKDIKEQYDVSAEHPELVDEIAAIFVKEHETPENDDFMMKALEQ
ncbi:arylsulfatase [Marinilongibacter aquaticus]|uniref:arylsulfatase n=1 Tax=Marinilongibacter aquaticus TaxID=2975157 RepID=UPI0021BDBB18|nr:arylsulfatase [Marinilongibacter aquaticus]UBM58191.1 arylsulfatase [Marinilongibacter aquaticus]